MSTRMMVIVDPPGVTLLDVTGPWELAAVTKKYRPLTDARQLTARRVAARLGLPVS